MFLQSLLQHKKKTAVLVNGHTYWVGEDLVVRDQTSGEPNDVPEIDATKLLSNYMAWCKWQANGSATKPAAKIEKHRIQLVTATGEVLPPPSIPVVPPLATKSEASPVVVPSPIVDPPIPAKGEDWADPKEEFSLEWLRACAKAYQVKDKTKDKKVLVQKLMKAMY